MKKTEKKQQPEQMHQESKSVSKEEVSRFVKEQVINKLGKPKNLNFIRASNVFVNRWRVDVWCTYDSALTIMATKCSKIFHSYFIHVDDHGKIVKSSPEIKKEY